MHVRRGRPFPTFLEAKADLLLEELTMGPQVPSQATVLVASGYTPGWHRLRGCPCSIVQEPPQQARRQNMQLRTAVERWAALQRPARQPED